MKFLNDATFDSLLLPQFKHMSSQHWIKQSICEKVSEWLGDTKELRFLDIGSGVGKFCAIMSSLMPGSHFVGVEINEELIKEALRLRELLKLTQYEFIHSCFSDLNFSKFDVFFFYNSFYEQVVNHGTTFRGMAFHRENYVEFNNLLMEKLNSLSTGAILISYQGFPSEVSASFRLVKTAFEGELILWIKK